MVSKHIDHKLNAVVSDSGSVPTSVPAEIRGTIDNSDESMQIGVK